MEKHANGAQPDIQTSLALKTLAGTVFEAACPDDAEELVDVLEHFFKESGCKKRGIIYSRQKALESMKRGLQCGTCPHIVARVDGRIVGLLSYTLDDAYCERPIAVLYMIYALPEYRRSAMGRFLVGLATATAAEVDNACAFHASFASGMAEYATLENLFTRAGFEKVGATMVRAL